MNALLALALLLPPAHFRQVANVTDSGIEATCFVGPYRAQWANECFFVRRVEEDLR